MSLLRITTIAVLATACNPLKFIPKDEPRQYEYCNVKEAVNDPFSNSSDGYALSISGQYDDLFFEDDAILQHYLDSETAHLSGTLKSRSQETHAYFGRFTFRLLHTPPDGAPVRDLKAAAYSENGGPVVSDSWSYYQLE